MPAKPILHETDVKSVIASMIQSTIGQEIAVIDNLDSASGSYDQGEATETRMTINHILTILRNAGIVREDVSVSDLLNEAAVRFDFSQYTDVNVMTDVNGAWGPLNVFFDAIDNVEFTDEGLHVWMDDPTAVSGLNINIEGESSSQASFGPEGITMMSVRHLNAPRGLNMPQDVVHLDISADSTDTFLPDMVGAYGMGQSESVSRLLDIASTFLQDTGTPANYNFVNDTIPGTSDNWVGRIIQIVVVDPIRSETHYTFIGESTYEVDVPFTETPDFIDIPAVVDGIYYGVNYPPNYTFIEDLVWNRALTTVEVDALARSFQ